MITDHSPEGRRKDGRRMSDRRCTCLGTCRGADGLGAGWICALKGSAGGARVGLTEPTQSTGTISDVTPEGIKAAEKMLGAIWNELSWDAKWRLMNGGISLDPIITLLRLHLPAAVEQQKEERPRRICLCGSTRFIEQFATATWELELQGHIVLGCTLLPAWFCGVRSHFAEATGTKAQRDWHHLRKIDLADEVLVLDIGGYVGESTRNEIEYAKQIGKPVRYVSQDAALLQRILPSQEPSLPAEDGWRPIESAPKDGTWIIGDGQHVAAIRWDKDMQRWMNERGGCECEDSESYTHWMPYQALPPRPEQAP